MILCALLVFNSTAFAAVFTFETQREHSSADIAWLTDLVIKENMETVDGMAGHLILKALPDEPYTETPESFRDEVNEYCLLYSLTEGSEKAALIYLFDLLGSDNSIYSAGASDRDVREYLQGNGITMPASLDSDGLIMARALYLAMMTGAFSPSDYSDYGAAVAFEQALISYVSDLSGIDKASLYDWMPGGNIFSIDSYILAASKLSLWSNGYDVSVDTPENEVYRLVAVMTIEKMGISIDRELSFDSLKLIYTAALLGKKYGVAINEEKLGQALAADNVPFYILQLIGQQKAGLSIRSENTGFNDAFYRIAENTSLFDIESDEFYADIYKYEVHLSSKCSKVWVYPTAYATGNDAASLTINANGTQIKNNFFTSVALDPSRQSEDIVIDVACSVGGSSSSCKYVITVYQGENGTGSENSDAPSSEPSSLATSDTIVAGIFSTLGLNTSVSSLVEDFYTALTPSLKNVISFIAPTFGEENLSPVINGNETTDGSAQPDEYYNDFLDKIGAMVDSDITGVGGFSLAENFTPDVFAFDFITFD